MNHQVKAALLCAVISVGGTALGGCAVKTGQSSAGQFVDDTAITTRVKAKFTEDRDVSAMRISVETLNGTVQLSGFATSEQEKSKAADLARNVPDVKSVRNDIVVRRPAN